jgi:hypothetical protein
MPQVGIEEAPGSIPTKERGGGTAWDIGGGLREASQEPKPPSPTHSCPLTFLGIKNAGLAQLAEERAPAAGGLQVVQVEVGRVQPAGQVGEAWGSGRRKSRAAPLFCLLQDFLFFGNKPLWLSLKGTCQQCLEWGTAGHRREEDS